MSDAPKSDDKSSDGWVMPEPVYRSTPGHTPNSIHQTDSADDITTQPGFADEDNIDSLAPELVQSEEPPAAKPVTVNAAPPAKKKGGCARSFLTVVSLITLAVLGVVIAVIYFLFYYKTADSTF